MISIVICGRTEFIDQNLVISINDTIGVPYEIHYIDNSTKQYDLFSAYNKGVLLCIYDVICFMHDDINYKTNNWGHLVLDKFMDREVGAIGIAGSPYASFIPGPWWSSNLVAQNVIQENHKSTIYYSEELKGKTISPVLLLDGVWFCIRKSIFKNICFDEVNYKGFHMYDMDISFQLYRNGYKLFCVYDILIEHASVGKLDKYWLTNRIIFFKKWYKILPASNMPLSFSKRLIIEFKNLISFLKIVFK